MGPVCAGFDIWVEKQHAVTPTGVDGAGPETAARFHIRGAVPMDGDVLYEGISCFQDPPMTYTEDDQTMPLLYEKAHELIAKMQAENRMLRTKCNMPPNPVDCQPVLQRLYDKARTDISKLETENAAIRKWYEGRIAEITKAYSKLLNIIQRVAGSVDMPKLQNGLMQSSDYDVIAEHLEMRLDKTVAAQNGRDIRGDGRHRVWLRTDLLDEYIQNDSLLHALTLLKPEIFEYIAYKVEEYIEAHGGKLYYDLITRSSDPGNRSKLKIRYIVFMNFFRKRTNDVLEVVGALFGMSHSTVKRQCDSIDDILEKVVPGTVAMGKRLKTIETSEEFIRFTGGKLMIDGTLTPAPDSSDGDNQETSGFSGKHKMPGFNTLLTCTGRGVLVHKSKTVPGNQHDMKVLKNNLPDLGLFQMGTEPQNEEAAKVIRKTAVYMDKGFIGIEKKCEHINAEIPDRGKNKKSPKELQEAYKSKNKKAIAEALGLTVEQYDRNMRISSERSLIERMIGRLKRWEILSGTYRGTASSLNQQFEILSGVVNLEILWPEIERNEGPLLAKLAARRTRHKVRR